MSDALNLYMKTGDSGGILLYGDSNVQLPKSAEDKINAQLAEASPMRKIASIRISTKGGGELYAMPAGTAGLLDDLSDPSQWLADEVRDVFAAQESAAFVNGDGVNKPRGFLQDAEKMATVSAPAIDVDSLLSLVYILPPADRQQGSFLINRRTLADVRQLKDADGNYIWQPSADQSCPSTLLGYPVTEMEDMPDVASGSRPVAFGNWVRGYKILDRQGVRVLRDPYSAKPYILFYTTKKVGGEVKFPQALATLQINT